MEYSIIHWITLAAITLIGAIAQTAIGFGFALITVPVFLLVLNVGVAVQTAMILSFSIALVMIFFTSRGTPMQTFRTIVFGSVIGFPMGYFLFMIATPGMIKLSAGIAILLAIISARFAGPTGAGVKETQSNGIACGVVSGAMVTSLAMAGPAMAVYASVLGLGKKTTRSLIFSVFVVSYGVAILIHGVSQGFPNSVLILSACLLPVTLLGMAIGYCLVDRISEAYFHKLLSLTLVGVAVYLIFSVV